MKIGVMKPGDEVLNVEAERIVIRRKGGEVDIIPILFSEGGARIDEENIITIGYGDNTVESEVSEGVKVIKF